MTSKILIRTPPKLGDLILSLPAVHAIRTHYSNAEIDISTLANLESVLRGINGIRKLMPYDTPNDHCSFKKLEMEKYDVAIFLCRMIEIGFNEVLASVPIRAGWKCDSNYWLTHTYKGPDSWSGFHDSNLYLYMIDETLGISNNFVEEVLPISHQNLQEMKCWLQARRRFPESKLVAISATSSYEKKDLSTSELTSLILMLREQEVECLLLEAPAKQGAHRADSTRVIVEPGNTNVGQLAALISLCDAFIGVDSGPMHVAGILGLPTIGIFKFEQPCRFFPLGSKVRVLYEDKVCSNCNNAYCMNLGYRKVRRIENSDIAEILQDLKII